MFQISGDAFVLIGPQGRVLRASPQCLAVFGYAPVEIEGRLIEDLIPERFHDVHLHHRREFSEHPHARRLQDQRELFARRKDGAEIPVDIALTPVSVNGNACVLAMVRDVTRQKRAEELLKRARTELEIRVAQQASELTDISQRVAEAQVKLDQARKLAGDIGRWMEGADPGPHVATELQPLGAAMKEFERAHLLNALALAGGRKMRAADMLGISRKNLWEKLRHHGIDSEAGN